MFMQLHLYASQVVTEDAVTFFKFATGAEIDLAVDVKTTALAVCIDKQDPLPALWHFVVYRDTCVENERKCISSHD